MITRKSTFFLGIFIFLIPFLGFPSSGKTILIVLSGLLLIWLSIQVSFTLPHRNQQRNIERNIQSHEKPIVKRPRNKKEKNVPLTIESIPTFAEYAETDKENEHEADTTTE